MIEDVFREEWGRVLASLIGFLGDFDLAEEAAQEAFAIAADRWTREGAPENPGAWLVTTARNRAIDQIRRARTLVEKTQLLDAPDAVEPEEIDESAVPDERLELIFTCCHPALAIESRVALTLRSLGGLTTEEIARAFLVAPEAMKRRLSRAKAKIKEAGIGFEVPPEHLLADRLAGVLAVVYLIFNQGYGGRRELAAEAIRLGRLLRRLMPNEPEVLGLLALILIHDARHEARFEGDELVLLQDQDRSLWNVDQIEEGRDLVDCGIAMGARGPYLLQAAIAVLQTAAEPDRRQILALYDELADLTDSPVVELNRAAAVAEAKDAEAALRIVDGLEGLDGYQYFHSTRGELLRRLGRKEEAVAAYRRAHELSDAEPERRFIERRIDEI